MNIDSEQTASERKEPLPKSLHSIIEELKKHRHLKPAEMRRIVLDAKVKSDDLMPWATFDHCVTESYGRKMIYHGGNFEVMVMSWAPGDFSTIHDHGGTQWGAVQVFGPAEHATFRAEGDSLRTLARWEVKPGDVLGVANSLIHQMGNPTKDQVFLSLHIYGLAENLESITRGARVFDPETNGIQRIDGGVFFALPTDGIMRVEKGPDADFPTRLRHMVELVRRLCKMDAAGKPCPHKKLGEIIEDTFSILHLRKLRRHLHAIVNADGFDFGSKAWKILVGETGEAAKLQTQLREKNQLSEPYLDFVEIHGVLSGQDMEKVRGYFSLEVGKDSELHTPI